MVDDILKNNGSAEVSLESITRCHAMFLNIFEIYNLELEKYVDSVIIKGAMCAKSTGSRVRGRIMFAIVDSVSEETWRRACGVLEQRSFARI